MSVSMVYQNEMLAKHYCKSLIFCSFPHGWNLILRSLSFYICTAKTSAWYIYKFSRKQLIYEINPTQNLRLLQYVALQMCISMITLPTKMSHQKAKMFALGERYTCRRLALANSGISTLRFKVPPPHPWKGGGGGGGREMHIYPVSQVRELP